MTLQLRIEGPSGSRVLPLNQGKTLIAGRDAGVDIVLADPDRLLSRQHLSLNCGEDSVEITVVSASGTVQTPVGTLGPGQKALLRAGDQLGVGDWRLLLEAAEEAVPAPAAAAATDPLLALLGGGGAGNAHLDPLWQPAAPAPVQPASQGFWVGGGAPAAPAGFSAGPAAPLDHGGVADLGIRPAGAQGDGAAAISDFLGPAPAARAPADLGALLVSAPAPEPWAGLPPVVAPIPAPAPPPRGEDLWDSLRKALVPMPATTPEPAPAPLAEPGTSPGFYAVPSSAEPIGAAPAVDIGALLGGLGPAPAPPAGLDLDFGGPAMPAPVASATPLEPAPAAPAGTATEALAKGLGIALPADMGAADWERLGSALRQLVQGFAQLMSARAALKRELRAHNKTEMPMRDVNPFKSELGLNDVLQQLLFNASRGGKFMPVERAVREAAEDLLTHDLSIIAASRACVQGTVQEFDPQLFVQRFGKKGLLDLMADAQLWRQYQAYYAQQSAQMADWLERLFEEHFVTAYCNEAERLSQQHVPLP